MGHQVKQLKNRSLLFILVVAFVAGLIYFAHFLLVHSFYYNVFHYSSNSEQPLVVKVPEIKVSPSELDAKRPVRAIPVIFYHGIIQNNAPDGVNVTRANFLSQMGALKKNGYYTIDAQDMVDFYTGAKQFYGKPILISFDDGRVDSYVPTDDILKQLGFKAEFSIVSGKQDNHTDPFFLTWNQLRVLNNSGRWDLEAHGWYSHTKIPIDAKGDKSNALTNRMWLAGKGRLETEQEAAQRITNDYVQNLKDLHQQIPNHKIIAYAVPYGDFGQKANNFVNDPSAKTLNYNICKTYFKICFDVNDQPYSFKDHNPLRTARLGVPANWNGADLVKELKQNAPNSPDFTLNLKQAKINWLVPTHLLGKQNQSAAGLKLTAASVSNGYVNYDIGNMNSYNYNFTATYRAAKATSVLLSGDKYHDADNSQDVEFGMTGNEADLRLTKNGVTQDIASQTIANFNTSIAHTLQIDLHDYNVACLIDGHQVFSQRLPLIEPHGDYGIDAYSPSGADVTFTQFKLTSNGL